MNWGKGIIIGMAVFVLFIVGMCIYMVASPTDDFDHQYYEKGLSFNHDYDREEQVTKDHAEPIIRLNNQNIDLKFVQPVKGTVTFMRPSSTVSDKVYALNSGNNNEIDIPIEPLAAGKWQLVFEWTSNNKAYLYQQEVFVK
ncbi:MAG: FixH family protein [Mucilaginibacter sp.]